MFVSLLVSGFYILATGTEISFNSTIIWHCGWSQRSHVTLLRMLCRQDMLHQSLTPWHQAAAATPRSTVLTVPEPAVHAVPPGHAAPVLYRYQAATVTSRSTVLIAPDPAVPALSPVHATPLLSLHQVLYATPSAVLC